MTNLTDQYRRFGLVPPASPPDPIAAQARQVEQERGAQYAADFAAWHRPIQHGGRAPEDPALLAELQERVQIARRLGDAGWIAQAEQQLADLQERAQAERAARDRREAAVKAAQQGTPEAQAARERAQAEAEARMKAQARAAFLANPAATDADFERMWKAQIRDRMLLEAMDQQRAALAASGRYRL